MHIRVYAVTQKNKFVVGALSVLIAVQHIVGIWFVTKDAMSSSESPNRFFVRVGTRNGF